MTAEQTETMDQEELLAQFRERFDKLIKENQELSAKIRENETTALKLQGAIETLEYLAPPSEPEPGAVEEFAAALEDAQK